MSATLTEPRSRASASSQGGLFTTPDGRSHVLTFALITSLFFLWALCNGMIDVMDKHFQDYLHLSKAQSAWVQFAHYLGSFLMATPAGWLASRLGYKGGIITGLLIVAVGCLWFIPATQISTFWAFLLGVCVISMGLTCLETIANPYTTVLGAPAQGAVRINIAQSFNGIGWVCGPIVGGMFFYSSEGAEAAHQRLWIPYAAVAGAVAVLVLIFWKAKMPDLSGQDLDAEGAPHSDLKPKAERRATRFLAAANSCVLGLSVGMIVMAVIKIFLPDSSLPFIGLAVSAVIVALLVARHLFGRLRDTFEHVWTHPHFSGATVAQFFYVAAQAGIFAFFINYIVAEPPSIPEAWRDSWLLGGASGSIEKNGVWHVTEQGATKLLAYLGFTLFLAGRFSGSFILRRVAAHRILGLYAALNVVMMTLIVLKLGWISVAALFLSFFFMSVMFPTIFALGIFGLGKNSKKASSFIVMAIMGGAILPKLMGMLGDHYGMSIAFAMPLVCFAIVATYGFSWSRLSGAEGLVGCKPAGGH